MTDHKEDLIIAVTVILGMIVLAGLIIILTDLARTPPELRLERLQICLDAGGQWLHRNCIR